MDVTLVLFALLLALVLPIGAILGIIAFARVARLEKEIRSLATGAKAPAPQAQAPTIPVVQAPAVRTQAPQAPPVQPPITQPKADIETVIGSAWLNRVGIVVLLFAAAFFLKFAFDNNWIGPIGRVVIGLIAGAGLLLWSEWLFVKRWTYFSEGIAALAVGVIYLSLYAGFQFYHFLTPFAAFAGMAATTATVLAISLGRDSQRLALLALAAGFITPLLINTGADPLVPLFTYLAILNAGLLTVARIRDWRNLPAAFFFTIAYAVAWWLHYFEPSKLALTFIFATIFFGEFSVLPLLRSRRDGAMRSDHVIMALLNAGWYTVALQLMFSAAADPARNWILDLNDTRRWLLTLAVLALGGGHLVAAQLVQRRTGDNPSLARVIYGSIALTLVTAAIPIRLHGEWLVVGWSVEAAALVWAGFTTQTRLLRGFGLVLAAIVAGYLAFATPDGGVLFFNARFGAFAAFVAALWVSIWQSARNRVALSQGERTLFAILEVAANVYGIVALTLEGWDWGKQFGSVAGTETPVSQLSVSVVWAVYATVLIVLGVWRNSALMRWQALIVFGVVILKIFLVDLTALALGFRIAAFFVVGALLLGVSFLYQRRRALGASKP